MSRKKDYFLKVISQLNFFSRRLNRLEREKDCFKTYLTAICVITLLACVFSTMEVLYSLSAGSRHVIDVLEIFYALTGLTNLLLLVATLILMIRASKRLTLYDHIKYENEKKRFLINLKLVIVLIEKYL